MRDAPARRSFFLPRDGGQRLCVFHPPSGRCHGRLLYVPPLAEEMNKARRMAALFSSSAAARGFAVLHIDLLGCGDSSGDFGDAGWAHWLDDLQHAHEWLSQQVDAPDILWGLRAGCLLAAALGERLGQPCHYLFWQPPASGRAVLQQFLRLQSVANRLDGAGGGGTEALRQRLLEGHTVEVAGYRVAPALASGLDAATLAAPPLARGLSAFELSAREGATLTPGTRQLVERWRSAGCRADASLVTGPAFWQTTEIEDAPALIEATLRSLQPEAGRG